jgi:hypothetical protein
MYRTTSDRTMSPTGNVMRCPHRPRAWIARRSEFSQDATGNQPPEGIGISEPVDDTDERTLGKRQSLPRLVALISPDPNAFTPLRRDGARLHGALLHALARHFS